MAQTISPRRAYSVREVAQLVGLEHKAVRRAILRGDLKAARVEDGNPRSKLLISETSLSEWLREES
jgi:excisionase family DNA binding protein